MVNERNQAKRLILKPFKAVIESAIAYSGFNELVFKTVFVGENGELFWKDIAEIKELDRSISTCEYDISPDFVFLHSVPVLERKFN